MKKLPIALLLAVLVVFVAVPAQSFAFFEGTLDAVQGGMRNMGLGLGAPVLNVGYQGQPDGGTSLDFDFGDAFFNPLNQNRFELFALAHSYRAEGLLLEAALPVQLPAGLQIRGRFSKFFQIGVADSSESFLRRRLDDINARGWNTADSDMWSLEGLVSIPVASIVNVVGGFRYTQFSTLFKSPEISPSPGPFFPASHSDPSQEADLTLETYQPFFGVETGINALTGNGMVNFGVIGFPVALGSSEYGESIQRTVGLGGFPQGVPRRIDGPIFSFDRGFFLEGFTTYTGRVMGADIGVFAKLTHLRARGEVDLQGIQIFNNVLQDTQASTATFYQTNYSVGGTVSVPFNLPM